MSSEERKMEQMLMIQGFQMTIVLANGRQVVVVNEGGVHGITKQLTHHDKADVAKAEMQAMSALGIHANQWEDLTGRHVSVAVSVNPKLRAWSEK